VKRWFAVCISLFFVAGCSGMGSGTNRFIPGATQPNGIGATIPGATATNAGLLGLNSNARHQMVRVAFKLRIPRHRRGERTPVHPATISPLTQSVSVAINGGAAQVFNTTTSSPNCSSGTSGLTCTFSVGAPSGNDTFVVTTYSATGGGGTPLNRGEAVVAIAKGKDNLAHVTLGPVVSTTADTGMGSLRYAIGTANNGDTIFFTLPTGSTITLASPITVNTSVSIAGPGVTSSIRMHRNRHRITSHSTFSGLTISGGGTQQLFIIPAGIVITISGLVLTDGYAGVAHTPGGLINSNGNLTLAGDALTGSTSAVTTLRVRPQRTHPQRPHSAPKPSRVPLPKPKVVPGKMRFAGLHPHTCTGSDEYGGAVYNNGTLVVSGSTFDSNMVSSVWTTSSPCYEGYGGAIYNDEYGTLISSGSTYSNNGAYYGGAVYNYSTYGQATFTGDTFTGNFGCTDVNGCVTTHCVIASTCTVYAYGDGVAIYDDAGPGITITDSTFSNNVAGGSTQEASGYGGALDLETGNPVITGTTFSGNLAGGGSSNCATGYGGAIYEDVGNPIVLNNDTFTNNQAGGDEEGEGGAIYNDDSPDQGTNDTFTGNVAYGTGSDCDTYSEAYGGAVYMYYGGQFSNTTFSNNVATSAYYTEGGVIYEDDSTILNNDTFTGNQCIGTGITDYYSYCEGGVIYNDSTLKLSNNTFTSNSAQAIGTYGYEVYGGVLYADSTTTSTNNTFASNTAVATYLDGAYIYGGVVYDDSQLVSHGDTFASNSSTSQYYGYGGAVYHDSTAYLSNDTFTSNTINAPYAYGGAIYNDSGDNSISGSTFTSNAAGTGNQGGYGGAVYDDYYETHNGNTYSGNTATSAGGAVYDDGGDTFNNDVLTGNAVTAAQPYYGGGGLYDEGPSTVNNSTFSGNTVTAAGLWVGGGGIYDDSGLTMTGSTVSGNTVNSKYGTTGGGGIALYDTASVANSTIAGNSSTSSGGGLIGFDSYVIGFTNSTIYQNTATNNGGNIENPYGVATPTPKMLKLTNSIVAGGTAGGTGADIDNPGMLATGDYNIIGKGVAGSGTFTAAAHDMVGSTTTPIDPLLLALNNNGGPTMTNADTAGSPGKAYIPAVSSNCNGTGVTTDQRGYTRGATTCDVGAYEFGAGPTLARKHLVTARHQHYQHHHAKPKGQMPAMPLGLHPHPVKPRVK
jgi:hypothetical protein